MRLILLYFLLLLPCACSAQLQPPPKLAFLQPADTFHKGRFWTSAITGGIVYGSVVVGLNELWYADYPRTSFQFFDDRGEWNDMDKYGHLFTTYFESRWSYTGARWAGIERRKAIWLGASLGMLYQTTVEMLDAFSEEWGFSIADMAYNTLGAAVFVSQEFIWQEQRIVLKVSSNPLSYPNTPIASDSGQDNYPLSQRAEELFGGSYPASFLKDYNAMTIWASANLRSFMPNKKHSKLPPWLNVAVGVGAGNMYGGFANQWEEDGETYRLDDDLYPRYRQFYLSLDIDLTRIKTKSHFLKTLFGLVNVIKIPAPTFEVNTLGQVRFHPIYF
ncbi:MAG: DUF2279 domain-containing protein [Bacteroidota bacterium]